jgi:aldehyde dehydrogenase (NAD+)
MSFLNVLNEIGLDIASFEGKDITVRSPIDGVDIAHLRAAKGGDVSRVVADATGAFLKWRAVPAPVRGELVRLLGNELRAVKPALAELVTIETGKITSEALGEVQEMIDICDFAVGLSRQLYGLTMPSERPGHAMREVWHSLGPVAIITAFNFPVAVWAWNAALALVCGNSIIWKPSEKTPVCALAVQAIFDRAVVKFSERVMVPNGLSSVLVGGKEVGAALCIHKDIPLVSATGSTGMGRAVAGAVSGRLARHLLELGGNAAMILSPSADRALALRAVLFGAVGTAGQRCTTLRRLIVHESIINEFVGQLAGAYESLVVGDPREDGVLVGPLIDPNAFVTMQAAVKHAVDQGGELVCGGTRVSDGVPAGGIYVRPAIVYMPEQTDIVRKETFAPILYVIPYKNFGDAVAMQNDVPQGLSSCIFTNHMREAELFLSSQGSDCGIANVNLGPSGAEIGGAFGGEKDTGGGRESGSDAWKAYMRRQTQTVNYSGTLPLAQGVEFGG